MADPRPPPGPADTAYIGTAPVPGPPGAAWADPLTDPLTGLPDEPPMIAPDELAGLAPAGGPAGRVRRVTPLADEPSRLIARYLFPTERFRGEWRRHPIHLANPLTTGVMATIALGLLSGFLATGAAPELAWLADRGIDISWLGAGWLPPVLVLAWLGVMGWLGWKVAYWHFDRFILTNKRVMAVHGIIARNVAMMPLLRVTDMKYEQSALGRMLNYGTFVLESAGQDQALREIPHLPHPNELYLRVVEEMYEPGKVESRLDPEDDDGQPERDRSGA